MKKFLSILLAVMMVLSSTVSYAAPSLAGIADTVVEAPVFEEELLEETPVDDSAELSEEETSDYGVWIMGIDFNQLTGEETLADLINGGLVDNFDDIGGSFLTKAEDATHSKMTANEDRKTNVSGCYPFLSTQTTPTLAALQKTEGDSSDMYLKFTNTKAEVEQLSVRSANGGQLMKEGHVVVTFEVLDEDVADVKGMRFRASSSYNLTQYDVAPSKIVSLGNGWSRIIVSFKAANINKVGDSSDTYNYMGLTFNNAVGTEVSIDNINFYWTPSDAKLTITGNDVKGIDDSLFADGATVTKTAGGVYTMKELEAVLDVNKKFYHAGYYLAGLKDSAGTVFYNDVTLTESKEYSFTAVWDKIKFIANYEFNNSTDVAAIQKIGSQNRTSNAYANKANEMFVLNQGKSTESENYMTVNFLHPNDDPLTAFDAETTTLSVADERISTNVFKGYDVPIADVEKFDVRWRFRGKVLSSTATKDFYPVFNGTQFSTNNGSFAVTPLNEWRNITLNYGTITSFQSWRVDFPDSMPSGSRIDFDYIRVVPVNKDAGENVLFDVGLEEYGIADFKVTIDEADTTTTVATVISNMQKPDYKELIYVDRVTLNGNVIEDTSELLISSLSDQDVIAIEWREYETFDYVFDNSSNVICQKHGAMTDNGDSMSCTCAANKGEHRIQFSNMDIPANYLEGFYMKVKVSDASMLNTNWIYWDSEKGSNPDVNAVSFEGNNATSSRTFVEGSKVADEWVTIFFDATKITSTVNFGQIYQTDENGDFVYQTDENGEYVLDANGNKTKIPLEGQFENPASGVSLSESGLKYLRVDFNAYNSGEDTLKIDDVLFVGKALPVLNVKIDETDGTVAKKFFGGAKVSLILDWVNEKYPETGKLAKSLKTSDGRYLYKDDVLDDETYDAETVEVVYGSKVLKAYEFTNEEDVAVLSGPTGAGTKPNNITSAVHDTTDSDGAAKLVTSSSGTPYFQLFDLNIPFSNLDDIEMRVKFEDFQDAEKAQSLTLVLNDATYKNAAGSVVHGSVTPVEGEWVTISLKNALKSIGSFTDYSVKTARPVHWPATGYSYTLYVDYIRFIGKDFPREYTIDVDGTDENKFTDVYSADAKVEAILDDVNLAHEGSDDERVAVALRVAGTNTVLSSSDTLADVPEYSTLEVLWSENDDFGFDFHAEKGGDVVSNVSYGTVYTSVSDFETDEETGYVYKRLVNETTTSDNFRLIINNLNIPPEKLSDIYITMRSDLASVSQGLQYVGSYESKTSQTSSSTTSSAFGSATVISGDAKTENTWYTLHFSVSETNYMYINGVGHVRYDFKNNLTSPGNWVDIADIRFVGTDVVPVAFVEGNVTDAEGVTTTKTFTIPYSSTTTVADILASIDIGEEYNPSVLTDANGTELNSDDLITTVLNGKSGYFEFAYENCINLTVNANVTGTDVGAFVKVPSTSYFGPSLTISDIIDSIKVSTDYTGLFSIVGLSTTADGELLAADTLVGSLDNGTTLHAVWKEKKVLYGTEFSEFDKLGDITAIGIGQSSKEKVFANSNDAKGVIANGLWTGTTGAEGVSNIQFPFNAPAAAGSLEAIEARVKISTNTADNGYHYYWSTAEYGYDTVYDNRDTDDTKDDLKTSGSYTLPACSEDFVVVRIDDKNPAFVRMSDFDLEMFRLDLSGTFTNATIEVDFIRFISNEYYSEYVDVNFNGLGDVTETRKFGYDENTTVADVLSRIVVPEGSFLDGLLDAEGNSIALDTKITAVADKTLSLDWSNACSVTVGQMNSIPAIRGSSSFTTDLDSTKLYSGLSSKTTLAELADMVNKDVAKATTAGAEYYFVDGFNKTPMLVIINRVTLPSDTTVGSLLEEGSDSLTLHAAWDEKPILKEWNFDNVTDVSEVKNISVSRGVGSIENGAFVLTDTVDSYVSDLDAEGNPQYNEDGSEKTKAGGATYLKLENINIPVADIDSILYNIKAAEGTYTTNYYVPNDIPYNWSHTVATENYELLWFKPSSWTNGPSKGQILKNFRIQDNDIAAKGTKTYYDYIRIYGNKPLPEVTVTDIDATYGSFGIKMVGDTEVAARLKEIDYTSSMTFADLVDVLDFEVAAEATEPYKIVYFTTEEDTETKYYMSQNMFEALGSTGTTKLVPYVEAVYETTYYVDLGEMEGKVSAPDKLVITDSSKTVADLMALVIDHGDKKLVGLKATEDGEMLDPSTHLETMTNVDTSKNVKTYFAVWGDYYVNDLFSVDFTENTGYRVGSAGKSSIYASTALSDDGKTYINVDEKGNPSNVNLSNFVEHVKDAEGEYIRLKFDASPYANATINKLKEAGVDVEYAGVWDSNIVFSDFDGDPYIPAGVFDKIVIRMRYGGNLPTETTIFANPDSKNGVATVNTTDFVAPFLYYTNDDYLNFTDSQKYYRTIDISNEIYRGNWITVVIDASSLELDEKKIYDLRLDPTNGMLDGSWLDIDYIRFVCDEESRFVDDGDVNSYADYEEGAAEKTLLAPGIRAVVNNDGYNGVRVKGLLYEDIAYTIDYENASKDTEEIGWMFSSSSRFKKAVGAEDGWMNKLTMELCNDESFNKSSLIVPGYFVDDNKQLVKAFGSYNTLDYEGTLFSAVLYNIPVKNYYDKFVVRPFVKYAGIYLYAEPFELSFADLAFGADFDSTDDDAHNCGDCSICDYIAECKQAYEDYLADKAASDVIRAKFDTVLATPDALLDAIIVPTSAEAVENSTYYTITALNPATGKFATYTVDPADTWPAVITNGALSASYTEVPCAVVAKEGETNVYHIMSLGNSRDAAKGNYTGIEKSDTTTLDDTTAVSANNLFIRNKFAPKSPFRKIDRTAQVPETGNNVNNNTFSDSFFLGDFGFGDYLFYTKVWSGTEREHMSGKTAYPLDDAKVVVKYNYSDGKTEWVTYDRTALYNLTTIDFKNVSYIVSNNLDNKPDDDATNSSWYYKDDGKTYTTTCPMQVEDLVFLYGEVDVPTVSASNAGFDAALYNTVRIRVNPETATVTNFTLTYTRSDKSFTKDFNITTYGGVDADGYRIVDLDMSETYSWKDTIASVTLNSTNGVDYIKLLATGYDSNTLPSYNDANVTGIFESFTNGFTINGIEGSSTDMFKPTEDFFGTTDAAKSGYASFDPKADADGDTTFADWTIDPLYTYDYYGIYNNIIAKSANYSSTATGSDSTWNFSSLYDGDWKETRWNTMVAGGDYFKQYYSSYEFTNGTVTETVDGEEVTYYAITDSEHEYTIGINTYTKPSKQLIYKPGYKYEVDTNGDGTKETRTGDVLTMTLNSSALYKGAPHYKWNDTLTSVTGANGTTPQAWHFWPHLLIQQSRGSQPVKVWEDETTGELVTEERYSAAADRIFAEFDIRLANYEQMASGVGGGYNLSFLLYAYLCPNSNPAAKIWFGIPLADESKVSDGAMSWGRESGANTHMCNLTEAMVYGSTENSISQAIIDGKKETDWIHIKLDLTPYIDKAIERSNAEDAYGLGVTTKEDWHFNGVNIGYECQGNVDATFELANFNFYSYNAQ